MDFCLDSEMMLFWISKSIIPKLNLKLYLFAYQIAE